MDVLVLERNYSMSPRNEISYLSEIIAALEELGGSGSLIDIYGIVAERNLLPSIRTNPKWRNNISATIQRHCRSTKSYRGASDLFYSVYGLGEGFWGLKNYANEEIAKETIEKKICTSIENDTTLKVTEKEMLIKARNGQGIFRDRILQKYRSCLITGISDKRLLVASHIHPWRSANNIERISAENGLLFSSLYDKLFDIGLISFSKEMKLIISSELSANDKSRIILDEEKVYLKHPSSELMINMEYHRDKVFRG